MIKVSVIIPIFNVEKYLKKSLDSVVNQTLKEIEIIAIDDGSTDNSLNILKEYQNTDDRIIIFEQENKGPGEARNLALNHVKGEYVFFLDSDDWIELNTLEKLYNNAIENNCDLVLFDSIEHLPNDEYKPRRFFILDNLKNQVFNFESEKKIVLNSYFVPWSKLYKTSFIKENNIRYPPFLLFVDVSFHIANISLAQRVTYLPEIFYHYNKLNESSVQNTKIEMNRSKVIFDVINRVEKFLLENNLFYSLESNFLEFKIKQPKILFDNLDDDSKEEFYQYLRKCFLSINSNPSILSKLDFEFYSFFIHVIFIENYEQYKVVMHYKNNVNELFFDYINKKEIDLKLNGTKKDYVDENSDIIVSLTSFPERINEVPYCIYSLLNQNLKPKKVVLWLASEEFPNKENDLPSQLLDFLDYGFDIMWCDNLKSFKKLIPSLKEFHSNIIVTADDDVFYPNNWLESLYNTYLLNLDSIICTRCRKIKIKDNTLDKYETWLLSQDSEKPSFLNLMTGIGGVLYPPNSLNINVFDYDLAKKLCPNADDMWFWAMAVLNKTKIAKVPIQKPISLNIARDLKLTNKKRLFDSNIGDNDIQVENILNNFPEILDIIGDDCE